MSSKGPKADAEARFRPARFDRRNVGDAFVEGGALLH
jgi:hypothetical protein